MSEYFTLANLRTALANNLRIDSLETGVFGDSTFRDGILNNGAKDFIRKTRALTTQLTLTLVADQREYDMSTNTTFLQIDAEGGVMYDSKRLTPTSLQKLDLLNGSWRDASSSTPIQYYVRNQRYLGLYPEPSTAVVAADPTLYVYSLVRPADMTAVGDVPFGAELLLEEYTEAPLLYATWKLLIRGKQIEEAQLYKKEYLEMVRNCLYDLRSPEDREEQISPYIYNKRR